MPHSTDAVKLYNPENPLMNPPPLPCDAPPLDILRNEHYLPAIRWGIAKARNEIAIIRSNSTSPTFENTVEALTFSGVDLARVEHIFGNMTAAHADEELRKLEEIVAPEIARFYTEVNMDEGLFRRVKAVYDKRTELNLVQEQATLLSETYKTFVRAGVHLEQDKKARLKEINQRLAEISTKFQTNDVKATGAFRKPIKDEAELDGVPERAKNIYRQQAREAGVEAEFLILLEPYPSDIMSHGKNRALREEVYKAGRMTCYKDDYDNTPLITEILRLRHEKAQLLGFETFAAYILADRMAGDYATVKAFLEKNLEVYKRAAAVELAEMKKFAHDTDNVPDLKPWDLAYYGNLLKEKKFDFKVEELRPYFDLEKVMIGMRQHAESLFDIEFREERSGKYPTYHPDIKTFEVFDLKTGKQIGVFYGDYFARPGLKNGGAWMNAFRDRGLEKGEDKLPLITNNSNFAKPTPEQPSLLSFAEVETVFHEFGHALHALLAEGCYPSLNGTNVKWDFVELPSQLMENWVGETEVLNKFARHHKTGQVIPSDLVKKLKDSKNFNVGTAGLRQTFLALLDLTYHSTDPSQIESPEALEKSIERRASLMDPIYGLMSPHFTHIFSGGYAAGYYGYKWAEILDADVFETFKNKGLYDPELKNRLRMTIFSKGGTVEPKSLYVEMMGREPDAEALFRREGLLPLRSSSP